MENRVFVSTRRACALALALAALSPLSAAPAGADPTDYGNLCVRAQTQTADLHPRKFEHEGGTLDNIDYPDAAGFAQSKPQLRPLTTTRYTTYEDAARTQPKQVRCKGKSADHIAAEYGARVTGEEGTCAEVNERTVREVAKDLTNDERKALVHKPRDIVIDPDTVAATGQDWVAEFPATTIDAGGVVHIPSKALYVPYDTPGIPEAFKGQHYCTLVAHAYLKRVMLGQVTS
jgi:hypothetical protein